MKEACNDASVQADLASVGKNETAAGHLSFNQKLVTMEKYRAKRKSRRDIVLGLHRKEYALRFGLVPEPNLTPLACINYLMDSLNTRRVSVAEAAAAVEKVTQYYSALSQSSPQPSQQAEVERGADTASPRQRKRQGRQLQNSFSTAQSSSQAARPPESLSVLATLSASQVHLTQQSANTFVTDLQDALLLEVLREFCRARPLQFTRVSYRDQRRMKERLSRVDLPPGKRAIVVADRRDPFFAVLLGVPRPPVARSSILTTTEERSDKLRAENEAAEAVAIEYITVAHRPIPWRRLVRRNIPRFFYKECAIAYVDRLEDEQSSNGECDRARQQGFRSPKQRMTVLLGADEEDEEEELRTEAERASFSGKNKNGDNRAIAEAESSDESALKRFRISDDEMDFPPSDTSSADGDGRAVDKEAIGKAFTLNYMAQSIPHHLHLFYSSEPFFTRDDGAGADYRDPLTTIPRVDMVGDRRSRRRTWMEKLLPSRDSTGREEPMAKLYRYTNTDDY